MKPGIKQLLYRLTITMGLATAFANAATEKVEITSKSRFSPERILVKVGDNVEFTNNSNGTHTVTADPSKAKDSKNVLLPKGGVAFHSGFLRPGQKFVQTFTVPGLYQYVCLPHESMGMMGQIEVKP